MTSASSRVNFEFGELYLTCFDAITNAVKIKSAEPYFELSSRMK